MSMLCLIAMWASVMADVPSQVTIQTENKNRSLGEGPKPVEEESDAVRFSIIPVTKKKDPASVSLLKGDDGTPKGGQGSSKADRPSDEADHVALRSNKGELLTVMGDGRVILSDFVPKGKNIKGVRKARKYRMNETDFKRSTFEIVTPEIGVRKIRAHDGKCLLFAENKLMVGECDDPRARLYLGSHDGQDDSDTKKEPEESSTKKEPEESSVKEEPEDSNDSDGLFVQNEKDHNSMKGSKIFVDLKNRKAVLVSGDGKDAEVIGLNVVGNRGTNEVNPGPQDSKKMIDKAVKRSLRDMVHKAKKRLKKKQVGGPNAGRRPKSKAPSGVPHYTAEGLGEAADPLRKEGLGEEVLMLEIPNPEEVGNSEEASRPVASAG